MYKSPRYRAWTHPTELFGRIGRRTRYHVCPALTSVPFNTSTMFWVSSVVHVSSVVTARYAALGFARTTARLNTAAQCATFSSVSLYERG